MTDFVPPRLNKGEIKYLALEGGGGKGNAFVGALEALADPTLGVITNSNYKLTNLRGVAGASAGAINAFFLASGFTPIEIKTILELEDFNSFLDAPDPGRVFRIGGFDRPPNRRTPPPLNQALILLMVEVLGMIKDIDALAVTRRITRNIRQATFRTRLRALLDQLGPIGAVAAGPVSFVLSTQDDVAVVRELLNLVNALGATEFDRLVNVCIKVNALAQRGGSEFALKHFIILLINIAHIYERIKNKPLGIDVLLNRDLGLSAQAIVEDFGMMTGEKIYDFFRRWLAVARWRTTNRLDYERFIHSHGSDIVARFTSLKTLIEGFQRSRNTFNGYLAPMTFVEFKRNFGIKLAVTGSNIETLTSHVFSVASTPNFYVVDAVRLSMSLPYCLFKPLIIRDNDPLLRQVLGPGESPYENDPISGDRVRHPLIGVWVDGGFFNNIPSHVFDRYLRPEVDAADRGETLSLRLGTSGQQTTAPVTNLMQYLRQTPAGIIAGTGEALAGRSYDDKFRYIALNTLDVELFEFEVTPEKASELRGAAIKYVYGYFNVAVPRALNHP